MFIDLLINSSLLLGAGYLATVFVSGLVARRTRPSLPTVPEGIFICEPDPTDAALVEAYLNRPKFTDNIVPFRRPAPKHPALEDLSIRQLKKLASEAKIRGYSNMTKAELIQRLQAVRRAA